MPASTCLLFCPLLPSCLLLLDPACLLFCPLLPSCLLLPLCLFFPSASAYSCLLVLDPACSCLILSAPSWPACFCLPAPACCCLPVPACLLLAAPACFCLPVPACHLLPACSVTSLGWVSALCQTRASLAVGRGRRKTSHPCLHPCLLPALPGLPPRQVTAGPGASQGNKTRPWTKDSSSLPVGTCGRGDISAPTVLSASGNGADILRGLWGVGSLTHPLKHPICPLSATLA